MKKTTKLPINMETVKEAAQKAGVRTTENGMERIAKVVKEAVAEDAIKTSEKIGQFSDARLDKAVGRALQKAGFKVSEKEVDEAREKVRTEVKKEENLKQEVKQIVKGAVSNAGVKGTGTEKIDYEEAEAAVQDAGFNSSSPEVKKELRTKVISTAARRGLRKACLERQLDTKSIYSAVQAAIQTAGVSTDEHVMAKAMTAIRPLREHLTHQLRDAGQRKAQKNAETLLGAACGMRDCQESCSTATTQKECGVRYQECFFVATNATDSTPKCSAITGLANSLGEGSGADVSPACLSALKTACPGKQNKGETCFDCVKANHIKLTSTCAGSLSSSVNEFCENSNYVNVTCSWHNGECTGRTSDICPVVVVEVKNSPGNEVVPSTGVKLKATKDPATWTVVLTDEEIIKVLDYCAKEARKKLELAAKLGVELAEKARDENVNKRSQTAVSLEAKVMAKIPLAKEDPDVINTALDAAKKFIATAPPSPATLEKKEAVADLEKALNIAPDGVDNPGDAKAPAPAPQQVASS